MSEGGGAWSRMDEVSRRTLLAALAAAGAGVAIGQLLADGEPVFAAPLWRHPFTFRANVPGPNSDFGPRNVDPPASQEHHGADYGQSGIAGAIVHSIAAGTVIVAQHSGAFGNHVKIAHSDSYTSTYGHMEAGSLMVEVGDVVTVSTPLGRVGTTGTSTGEHLHLEVQKPGWPSTYPGWVNPEDLVRTAPLASPVQPQPERKRGVTTRFIKMGTGSPPGGLGTVIALAGDAGFPGPGNWQEYTRNPADGSNNDRAFAEFKAHGEPIWIPAAQWDALKAAYTQAGPTTGTPQTVNLSADDRALLADIAAKLS